MVSTFLLAVSLVLAGVTRAQGWPWPTRASNHQHTHDQQGRVSDGLPTQSDRGYSYVVSDRTVDIYKVPATAGDEDDYMVSESRNQPVVERQPVFPCDDQRYEFSDTEARPVVRPGLRARRRRLLDPERRRQLRLRRQKLGLPIIKSVRNRQQLPEKQETEYFLASTDPTEPTTSISTSTSSSISFSSVTSSSSTTSRSAFPSFRTASKLRQRVKKINGWGMKTNSEVDELEATEEESQELESALPIIRELAEQRRGLPKVLKRPLPRRLTPTLVASSTTTSTPTEAPKEVKRLRYRPELGSKKSRSKVKTITVRNPSYEHEPLVYETERPSYEHKSAVDEPKPQSYENNTPVYIPGSPFLNSNSPVYNFERPTHEHALLIYEPSYAPVPKKVVLEPLATMSNTQHEPAYAPRNIYDQIPVLASNRKYASESIYNADVTYAPAGVRAGDSAHGADADEASEEGDNESEEYGDADKASEEGDNESEEYGGSHQEKPGIFDQYKYGYNVESEATGNYHARYEARDGPTVSGSYKVALPDGRVQVVTYVADDKGFRADVNYEGEEKTHTTPITPTEKSSVGVVGPALRLAQDHETREQEPDYFPVHDSHPHRAPGNSSPRPHQSRHYPSPQLFHAPLPSLTDKNLHFQNHVTTASPNPFRLVVESGRASTLAPPPLSTTPAATLSTFTRSYDIVKQLTTTPDTPAASKPKTFLTTPYPPVTNAHVADNGFIRTVVAKNYPGATATSTTATKAHTDFQDHTPTPTPTSVYQYKAEDSPASHTTLYSPDAEAVAYIQALGRSHLVPVLLPYTPPPQEHASTSLPHPYQDVPTHQRPHQHIPAHPRHNVLPLPTRNYYLNRQSRARGTHHLHGYHDGDSVEILRGDDRRPRLSLKVPAPHEADIYPSSPPFYHL